MQICYFFTIIYKFVINILLVYNIVIFYVPGLPILFLNLINDSL